MHPEEGKVSIFFPALCTCVEMARRNNFHRRSPVGRWRQKNETTISFLHPCLLGNFFPLAPPSLIIMQTKNRFFPLPSHHSTERKALCAWKKCVPTLIPVQKFHIFIVTLFSLLSNYCLFWAVCARRRRLCVWLVGDILAIRSERNSKLK